jgi:hypothetical protein
LNGYQFEIYIHRWGQSALGAAGCALPGNAGYGAERITLANGFDLVCNHHQIVDGRVRVYPRPSEPDYFELKPEAITGYETVPDPPARAQSRRAHFRSSPPARHRAKSRMTRLTAADLHQLLSKAGAEHNVDEDLLASVVKAESGGMPAPPAGPGRAG